MSEKSTIKQLMASAKVTQQQVADRMKVSQSRVARMLKPDADLRLSTLKRLAKAMGVNWVTLAESYDDREDDPDLQNGGEANN
jgi:transcriptional regulator with XRE-family HTH domain